MEGGERSHIRELALVQGLIVLPCEKSVEEEEEKEEVVEEDDEDKIEASNQFTVMLPDGSISKLSRCK